MNIKLAEHKSLEATHIHTLWETDLTIFLDALDKQEALDEKDRLSHKRNQNQKKAPAKKQLRKQPAAVVDMTMDSTPEKPITLGKRVMAD